MICSGKFRSPFLTEPLCLENLSLAGDSLEIAQKLYAALIRLDRLGLEVIAVERFSVSGVGVGIMDRLSRAIGG